ncbi:MAG: PAS domain S-box protein [bacterium]
MIPRASTPSSGSTRPTPTSRSSSSPVRRTPSSPPQLIAAGAQDYLNQVHIEPELLHRSIQYAISRKRAEEDLRRERDLLNRVMQTSPVGIKVLDTEGNVIWVNEQAGQPFGVDRSEMRASGGDLSRWVTRDWEGDPIPHEEWPMLEAIRTGEVVRNFPMAIGRDEDELRYMLINAAPLTDAQGNVTRVVVTLQDLSDLRTALLEVKQSHQLLEAILEGLPDTVLLVESKSREILYANPAVERIFGYTPEELIGRTAERLYADAEHFERWVEKENPTLKEEGLWHAEYVLRRKAGEVFPAEQTISVVRTTDDGRMQVVSVVRDISERKQAEEERRELKDQLSQSQKMEAVGRLAGGIAHDFNNLITVIKGNAEMAARSLEEDHPLTSKLEAINRAATNAADLTNQLLTFSRKSVTELRRLDLNDVVEDTERMLGRIIGEDILLEIDTCPDGCRVKADPSQIHQVVLNLAVNARDAQPAGGRIRVRTGHFRPAAEYRRTHPWCTAPAYVFLEVEDHGPGMDEATRQRVFEPFFTTKECGTGLGLSTVYGVVDQHDGHVEVESTPGEGATFRVLLPEAGEEKTEPEEGETMVDRPQGGEERVLLVEDENSVRELVNEILTSAGYRVEVCTGPEEAVKAVEDAGLRFDLLLTDVVMPDSGGGELAERIQETLPEMKIIFMSGYTDDAMLRHGVMNEEVDFVGKPFTPATLLRKVREVLDREKG